MGLSRREKTALVLLGVVVGVGLGGYAADWYVKDLAKLRAEKAAKEADLRMVEEKVRNLANVEKRVAEAKKLQEDYERMIPKSEELPQLLRDMANMLTAAGVDLLAFRPGQSLPVNVDPALEQKIVSINIDGTYTQIMRMFETLRSAKRLIGIRDFSIRRGSGNNEESPRDPPLTCQFNMIVFYNRPPAAASTAGAPGTP